MWLLILLLSIKMNLPVSYWILFAIITVLKTFVFEPIKFRFYQGYCNAIYKSK